MWTRYALVALISFLVGALIGSYFIRAGRAAMQPAMVQLQPTPEQVRYSRFVAVNPQRGRVTVYQYDSRTNNLRALSSARY